jgi:hypothetical protein
LGLEQLYGLHFDLYRSHPAELITKWTTLIPSNTKQVYLKPSCSFTCKLHVSALSQTIIRHVNTNIL